QAGGVEIEHGFRVRLIALARVVAFQHQEVGDPECGGAEELALQGNAVAVAAGQLKYGLDSMLKQRARCDGRFEMRAGACPVRYIDRIRKVLERRRLGGEIGETARDRRRDFRGEREPSRVQDLLQAAAIHASSFLAGRGPAAATL